MARYGKEHKEATRRRIIETAGRRFKQDGIDGSGVATLMADAGLTNGAFYAHFDSKDDLVATVVGDQLGRQASEFSELPAGRAGLEVFVHEYLSPAHRDHPDLGCPSAALLDEIGRCTAATKKAYTAGAKAILDEICTRLAPEDPESARGTALSAVHDARRVHAAGPGAGRQEAVGRRPRGGHPERPDPSRAPGRRRSRAWALPVTRPTGREIAISASPRLAYDHNLIDSPGADMTVTTSYQDAATKTVDVDGTTSPTGTSVPGPVRRSSSSTTSRRSWTTGIPGSSTASPRTAG